MSESTKSTSNETETAISQNRCYRQYGFLKEIAIKIFIGM